ncbi:ComF family protein [Brevundimonas sp. NPDC090276]|uniref:ComF family protein n=1 Tax=Brevundimonas sp. NPDC090276 TaxID=3363956 RepID=UPI003839FC4A
MKLEQPKLIEGPWDFGFALDKHTRKSVCVGHNEHGHPVFETDRTPMGEALFQLKYRQDNSQVQLIADAMAAAIGEARVMQEIGMVIPMPATTARLVQPVDLLADAVAQKLGVPMFSNVLTKDAQPAGAPALKNMRSQEEKIAALEGKFRINDNLVDGRWNVLMVDDLYDSGASMVTAVNTLKSWRKVEQVYSICCTWK